jgi:hypothetical protein
MDQNALPIPDFRLATHLTVRSTQLSRMYLNIICQFPKVAVTSTLKKESQCPYEALVLIQQSRRHCFIPEDLSINIHYAEHYRSY